MGIEITSMSSRGQVVIPQGIREQLHLHEGEKFIVVGEEDMILLKKLETPSFKNFDKLLQKTRELVKQKGIKPADLKKAMKEVRGK